MQPSTGGRVFDLRDETARQKFCALVVVVERAIECVRDAFRYDRRTGTSTLISRTADGTSANEGSEDPALSTNGRLIVPAGSGHSIHWEQPTLVIDAVRQVIAQAIKEN